MGSGLKRFLQEEPLFALFLSGLFAALTALSLVLLTGESKRNALLMEYEAQRIASALMESYRAQESLLGEIRAERILGFGVYAESGSRIAGYGSAPDSLEISAQTMRPESFQMVPVHLNEKRKSLTLVRRIGYLSLSGSSGMHRRMQGVMPLAPGAPQLLFLEIDVRQYWATRSMYQVSRLLAPPLILAVMTLIGFLYWRNAAYRKKLSAQQQLVRLGQVSRTLSHEIRNPLSAIRIQTGILKKTLPESGGEELKVIDEEVQRLALLTERVGDFLRDPLGSPEKIELAGFIRELIRRYERPIAFASQAQAGVRARVDPQRFRSVLENLIRNAIESMEGRETRRSPAPVEIFLAARKGRVEISVLDRGRGIPPELRDRIFDPFTTGKVRGSGIGLSICRRFVEAAGGRISLSDRPGGGTEARIELDQAGS